MKTPIDKFIEEVQADAEFFGRTFNKPEVVTYEYGDDSGAKGLEILPRDGMPRRFNVAVFGDGDGSGLHNQWKEDDTPADRTREEK